MAPASATNGTKQEILNINMFMVGVTSIRLNYIIPLTDLNTRKLDRILVEEVP